MPACHGRNVESAVSSTNVETLARALARSSARLALMPDEAERSRLAGALASIACYVDLLGSLRTTYALKLELADGRWDVAESELASTPHAGDVLNLASGRWCVRGTQVVHPSGSSKPAREFLVCAQA